MIAASEELRIEKVTESDRRFIFELMNSPNWLKYIGDRNIRNHQDAGEYIKSSIINSYNTHGYGLYKVSLLDKNIPMGVCGLLKRTYLDRPDLGFAILPKFERQGYTMKASKLVLRASLEQGIGFPIHAITSRDNIGSRALLKGLGMKHEGKIRSDGGECYELYTIYEISKLKI